MRQHFELGNTSLGNEFGYKRGGGLPDLSLSWSDKPHTTSPPVHKQELIMDDHAANMSHWTRSTPGVTGPRPSKRDSTISLEDPYLAAHE